MYTVLLHPGELPVLQFSVLCAPLYKLTKIIIKGIPKSSQIVPKEYIVTSNTHVEGFYYYGEYYLRIYHSTLLSWSAPHFIYSGCARKVVNTNYIDKWTGLNTQ